MVLRYRLGLVFLALPLPHPGESELMRVCVSLTVLCFFHVCNFKL